VNIAGYLVTFGREDACHLPREERSGRGSCAINIRIQQIAPFLLFFNGGIASTTTTSVFLPFLFSPPFCGLRWAGQVALLPTPHCVDTACGGYLRRVSSACARWTLAVVRSVRPLRLEWLVVSSWRSAIHSTNFTNPNFTSTSNREICSPASKPHSLVGNKIGL